MSLHRVFVRVFDPFNEANIEDWLAELARVTLSTEADSAECELSVVVTDDDTVASLNEAHRGLSETTDVLSFSNVHSGTHYGPSERVGIEDFEFVLPPDTQPTLGEVVISHSQAQRQADEAGHPLRDELAHLLAHGIFHLLGYDHEREDDAAVMRSKERQALEAFRRLELLP